MGDGIGIQIQYQDQINEKERFFLGCWQRGSLVKIGFNLFVVVVVVVDT